MYLYYEDVMCIDIYGKMACMVLPLYIYISGTLIYSGTIYCTMCYGEPYIYIYRYIWYLKYGAMEVVPFDSIFKG